MPPQPNSHSLPQAQHLRRESSQSAHSDMSNANMGRGYPPSRGRGGYPQGHYNPQMANHSPQPYRSMPQQMGRGMTPPFQPPGQMAQRSPYTQNRSPAMTPATMHTQQQFANPQGMPYYQGQPYAQQVCISSTMFNPPIIFSVSSFPAQLSSTEPQVSTFFIFSYRWSANDEEPFFKHSVHVAQQFFSLLSQPLHLFQTPPYRTLPNLYINIGHVRHAATWP